MTRLLMGLVGGLFGFDMESKGGPRLLIAVLQPMALAVDPSAP
jgi:hypothetical protein